jgi:hypothetical protein
MSSSQRSTKRLSGTVPELLFEKKQLIPALQQLLIAGSDPPEWAIPYNRQNLRIGFPAI